MNYALVNGQELLLGPIGFNVRLINSELEDLEIDFKIGPQDYNNVPIYITESVKLLPAILVTPSYDDRFEELTSFYQTIEENQVIFTQDKVDKPLERIKDERKSVVTEKRRSIENTVIEVDLNGEILKVSTSREERVFLATKLTSTTFDTYNFKFDDGVWKEITSNDLKFILNKIDEKVQEVFDWELSKIEEIDACITKEDVYNVLI
jgi:hypothetical protein